MKIRLGTYSLLVCCSLLPISKEYIQEVQQLIKDVREERKSKQVFNQRTNLHCEPPLLLLARQPLELEKILKNGNDKIIIELIKEVLTLGADPNIAIYPAESAFGTAIKYSTYEVIKLFLDNGASPNLMYHHKDYAPTPLLIQFVDSIGWGCWRDKQAYKEIAELLTSAGIDIDKTLKDVFGRTVIDVLHNKINYLETEVKRHPAWPGPRFEKDVCEELLTIFNG